MLMLFYVDVEDNEAFIVFICSLLSPLGTFVQELKVKSCTLSSTEVTAFLVEKVYIDDKGDYCMFIDQRPSLTLVHKI